MEVSRSWHFHAGN